MSTIHINRKYAGVSVNPSHISEVSVHVTTNNTHALPFCNSMRLYMEIDSGEVLDNLIEALIEARAQVIAEANRRWNEEVMEDADSELVGNPKEDAA